MCGVRRGALPHCRLSCDLGQSRGVKHSPATRGTRFYPVPRRSAGSEPPCTQRAQSGPCPAETGPNKGKPRLGERVSSHDALSKSPLRWGGSRQSQGEDPGPHASPERPGMSQLPQLLAAAADAHRDLPPAG